ncbi:MAG: tetratricopeptide repeat protein [Chitinispirillaceae bacterium]
MDISRRKINPKPPLADERRALLTGATAAEMTKEKCTAAGIALLLAVVTAVAYSGMVKNDFVNYDDNVYVTSNIRIQQGLSWEGVTWAFTAMYADNWHPLTWLSHMLDVQMFGLNPAGHHFTNLLFHILATLLLFGFLRSATGTLRAAAFVAALFALHPAHVESVAWVAERKDVLSAVFWFATMWAYVHYARRPGVGRYAMVLILFALGLMSKPMLVTLPVIALLLDYWPLERINRRTFGRMAAEKIPMLCMAAASTIITVIAQHEVIAGLNRIGLATRISNAALSYCIYLGQAFWPADLAVFYPYMQHPLPLKVASCALLLVTITAAVVWTGGRKKILITGWFWYIVTLLPVIGIVQAGEQAHADRYTYLPFIGIFIMLSWGLKTMANRLHNGKELPVKIAAAVVLLAMTGKTMEQVGYWKSDFTLFSHATAVIKRNHVAYNNLGLTLYKSGRTDEALAQYRKALEIKPDFAEARFNLGFLLANSGRTDEATAQYRKALEIKPGFAEARINLGVLLEDNGRADEAIAQYRKVLEFNPGSIGALTNLARAFVRKGRLTDAVPLLQRALASAKSAGDERRAEEIAGNLEMLCRAIRLSREKPQ